VATTVIAFAAVPVPLAPVVVAAEEVVLEVVLDVVLAVVLEAPAPDAAPARATTAPSPRIHPKREPPSSAMYRSFPFHPSAMHSTAIM
jgi:hypothetical protein